MQTKTQIYNFSCKPEEFAFCLAPLNCKNCITSCKKFLHCITHKLDCFCDTMSWMQALGWQNDAGATPLSFGERLRAHRVLVIGVSGKIGSGKTTLCNALRERLLADGERVQSVTERNFADALKEQVAHHFGLDVRDCYTHDGKQRVLDQCNGKTLGRVLQDWGQALRTGVVPHVWVSGVRSWLQRQLGQAWSSADTHDKVHVVLIGDVRYPNEVAFVQRECGGRVVRLNGDPGGVRRASTRDLEHESETALDNVNDIQFDYTIDTERHNAERAAQLVHEQVIWRALA